MPGSGFPGNDAPYWRYVDTLHPNPGVGNPMQHFYTILSEAVSVIFTFTTSAVAGVRRAQILLTDASGNFPRGGGMHTTVQPPGTAWTYQAFLGYGLPPMDSGLGILHIPLSPNMIALPGDKLLIIPFGMQAGDTITQPKTTVREFLDNADNTNIR